MLFRSVTQLIRHQDSSVFDDPKTLKRMLVKLGEALFRKLLKVKQASLLSWSLVDYDRVAEVDALETQMNRLLEQEFCFSIQDLKINGTDLIDLGLPAGRAVGNMLERLFNDVVDEKISNEKSALIEAAKDYIIRSHK